MFYFILFTVLFSIIFEPCCVSSAENGITVNGTDLTKILGGNEVPIDKYPFIVSIQMPVSRLDVCGGLGYCHLCGGSLVRADWVLTAAHCLVMEDKDLSDNFRKVCRVTKLKYLFVLAGLSDAHGASHGHPNRIAVRSTHINKYYDPSPITEDIGLMRLVSKFKISQQIQLTRLPERSTYGNLKSKSCTAIGWGLTSREYMEDRQDAGISGENKAESNVDSDSRSGTASNILKAVDLKIYPFEKCKEKYGSYLMRQYMSTDYQLCVEALQTKSVLQGDSGGPLLCGHIQMGVTSYGDSRKEAEVFIPSVYTRIDFYLDWINATISTANALQTSRGSWWMNYAIMLALAVALKQIIIMK